MKPKLLFPILLLVISVSTFSCKNSAEPEGKNSTENITSQDFTFEVTRLGLKGARNGFYDVWPVDENNIWAVGWVSLKDTTKVPSIQEFNMMHWNGEKWISIAKNYVDMQGIWGFPGEKLFLASGQVWTFENDSMKMQTDANTLKKGNISTLWASSEDNVWGAGLFGGIVHYDGKTWKGIDYDRQWHFITITGSKITGVAYALARNDWHQTKIVKLQNSTVEDIYTSESESATYNGWTLTLANEKELFIGYNPIWKLNLETKAMEAIFTPSPFTYISSCFAVSPADIYFYGCNDKSDVMIHFNGKIFKEFALPGRSDLTKAIKATSTMAASVSFADGQAQIITIKRK